MDPSPVINPSQQIEACVLVSGAKMHRQLTADFQIFCSGTSAHFPHETPILVSVSLWGAKFSPFPIPVPKPLELGRNRLQVVSTGLAAQLSSGTFYMEVELRARPCISQMQGRFQK